MTTLHGNPVPPNFNNGEELSAAEFNAVKNYWVTDELPETAENGDVVFVIEGDPAGGGGSSWGDFTTNGDEDASDTYTDAVGRTWKWAEWNDASKTPTVSLTGGLYHVLCVGGGSRSYSGANYLDRGQPGLVNEGLWEFSANEATPITVGKAGIADAGTTSDKYGQPSSIGDYGTQGISPYGNPTTGRGGAYNDNTGYKSSITSSPKEYATGRAGADVPGRGGEHAMETNNPGCVIIATVTNDPSDWNPPGQLPGVGGWATITEVTGTYKQPRYEYNDGPNGVGGTDWVAYEFTADGSLTTQAGGLVDALLVGRGNDVGSNGPGGIVNSGMQLMPESTATIAVGLVNGDTTSCSYIKSGAEVVGARGARSNYRLGAGCGFDNGSQQQGIWSKITGKNIEYGGCGKINSTSDSYGVGYDSVSSGRNGTEKGVVIVRVPKAYADNVQETFHGWLNFATVENGVVTSVNKTPDNIPYTTAVDEVPCGPEVAEGYFYDGSEFVAPEPDYSDQIKELEETLKNLRSAK